MRSVHRARRRLAGRSVVIIGASSGIGRAAALVFAQHRCRLLLAARDEDPLHHVAERCRLHGADAVVTVGVDIGIAGDVERLKCVARQELQTVDVWINLAAGLESGDITAGPVPEIERLVATNVLGPLLLSRAALGFFDEQGHGTLINVASLLGLMPNPVTPVYSTTKFAVCGLTKTLQQSRRAADIDVCLVLPGSVDTPMFAHAANHSGRL